MLGKDRETESSHWNPMLKSMQTKDKASYSNMNFCTIKIV